MSRGKASDDAAATGGALRIETVYAALARYSVQLDGLHFGLPTQPLVTATRAIEAAWSSGTAYPEALRRKIARGFHLAARTEVRGAVAAVAADTLEQLFDELEPAAAATGAAGGAAGTSPDAGPNAGSHASETIVVSGVVRAPSALRVPAVAKISYAAAYNTGALEVEVVIYTHFVRPLVLLGHTPHLVIPLFGGRIARAQSAWETPVGRTYRDVLDTRLRAMRDEEAVRNGFTPVSVAEDALEFAVYHTHALRVLVLERAQSTSPHGPRRAETLRDVMRASLAAWGVTRATLALRARPRPAEPAEPATATTTAPDGRAPKRRLSFSIAALSLRPASFYAAQASAESAADAVTLELLARARADSRADTALWRSICFQLVYTLVVLEETGVQHNDLHSVNVFIERRSAPTRSLYKVDDFTMFVDESDVCVKIGDFDFGSKRSTAHDESFVRNETLDAKGGSCRRSGSCNIVHGEERSYMATFFDVFTVLTDAYLRGRIFERASAATASMLPGGAAASAAAVGPIGPNALSDLEGVEGVASGPHAFFAFVARVIAPSLLGHAFLTETLGHACRLCVRAAHADALYGAGGVPADASAPPSPAMAAAVAPPTAFSTPSMAAAAAAAFARARPRAPAPAPTSTQERSSCRYPPKALFAGANRSLRDATTAMLTPRAMLDDAWFAPMRVAEAPPDITDVYTTLALRPLASSRPTPLATR